MTTTSTASPELPDLDKLEAYATSSKNGDWHATEAMLNMLDEDDVLALVAAARRAQSEGEAPQADLRRSVQAITRLLIDREWADMPLGDPDAVALFDAVDALVSANNEARAPAATLSPLCGAQHAESGKEVEPPVSPREMPYYGYMLPLRRKTNKHDIVQICDDEGGAIFELNTHTQRSLDDEKGLAEDRKGAEDFADFIVHAVNSGAAQQAAAPGALLEILRDVHDTLESQADSDIDHFEDDEEERECAPVQYAARKVMEVMDMLKAAPSAPGTPEAPADLPRLYRFDCYVGKTKMAAGVGVHASTMEEAEQKARKLIDKEETIKFESNQPCHPTRKCSICAAYERAAQLDGGQGGSESNG